MQKFPGFSISMVYPIMKAIKQRGYNFEQFCQQVGLDTNKLQNAEARIDGEELLHIIYEAAAYIQDDHIGLTMGLQTEMADLGILGYVMMHSASIADALAAYQRYHIISCSGFNIDWKVEDDMCSLRFFNTSSTRLTRHCMEDMVCSLYQLIVRMSNRSIPVHDVLFQHASPADMSPYVSVFGTVPQFSAAHNILRIDSEVLHYPVLYADARLRRTFEPLAETIRGTLLQGKVFTDKVNQYLMDCLPTVFPSLQDTARFFGLSARSLQAKLKDEQTTYQELAAQVRKEMAVSYLRRQEHSIAEIAYLLHFSEPSSFSMAFKRWTGITPGQYREQMLQQIRTG